MSENTTRFVYGAANCAAAAQMTLRQFYLLAPKGAVPGAKRFGGKWALDLRVFEESFRTVSQPSV
jgi:hypothetical protein